MPPVRAPYLGRDAMVCIRSANSQSYFGFGKKARRLYALTSRTIPKLDDIYPGLLRCGEKVCSRDTDRVITPPPRLCLGCYQLVVWDISPPFPAGDSHFHVKFGEKSGTCTQGAHSKGVVFSRLLCSALRFGKKLRGTIGPVRGPSYYHMCL